MSGQGMVSQLSRATEVISNLQKAIRCCGGENSDLERFVQNDPAGRSLKDLHRIAAMMVDLGSKRKHIRSLLIPRDRKLADMLKDFSGHEVHSSFAGVFCREDQVAIAHPEVEVTILKAYEDGIEGSYEQVISALAQRCYRPATVKELLALAIGNREISGTTIAFGSMLDNVVPFLISSSKSKEISITRKDILPALRGHEDVWVLAVRNFTYL